MRRFEKLPNPQGVGENQTATVDLPLGPTYNAIYISLLASNGTARTIDQMKTLIGDIRLIVNGDTRIEISATDLIAMGSLRCIFPNLGRAQSMAKMPQLMAQPPIWPLSRWKLIFWQVSELRALKCLRNNPSQPLLGHIFAFSGSVTAWPLSGKKKSQTFRAVPTT